MLEVIGYEENPKTGLMKAIYKDHGPSPASWMSGKTLTVIGGTHVTTPNKSSINRTLAKENRAKKKRERDESNH